ncbi:MAG TPA: glycosyltransferase family 4 protein [Candidatus Magasanikbacteria bacterium]|nr:glycosyltransferase family 4 protein [Candidatus Magasanikbacteria bacterium]
MRIAMIGQKGIPAIYGGVERHVHDLSVRLVEHGHGVTVYARKWYTGKNGTDQVEGVTRVHTPTIKTKHLDTIVHVFTSTIHALFSSYDVIHYHGVGPALLAWIPRVFKPQVRVIVTLHSLDRFHQKWNVFAKYMLKLGEKAANIFADDTITVSKSLHEYVKAEYGVETTYIPNGVEIPQRTTSVAHIASFGLTRDNYIVMISRLVPHKGAHVLIEAFKKLKERNINDTSIQSLKLAIVGGAAYTDKYVQSLHVAAASMNDVVFTDFQSGDALNELYSNARVLVHPSINEGLPITVLQAMSHAIPVLLSSIPEHEEILSDEKMFFKENDVESLVSRLEVFMKLNKQDRLHIGKQNKAIIYEKYDWEHVVSHIEDVYRGNHTETNSIFSTLKV